MELSVSQIRYLLMIYKLSNNGVVRSTDIATSLTVTRPSVHKMIAQLSKMNLVAKEKYSYISITEKGWIIARQYHEGFSYISDILQKSFKLSSEIAEEGALAILSNKDLAKPELINTYIDKETTIQEN